MARRLIATGVVVALLIGAALLGVRAHLAATEPTPLPQQTEETEPSRDPAAEPHESGDDDGRSTGHSSPRRPAAPNPAPQHP